MRLKLLALAVASLTLSACWHVTVVSGAQPSPTVVDKPWQHSFIFGLVPPPELNVKEQCPSGIAKVEAVHSFVNLIADAVTSGIYSPIAVKVTCAAR
jgi:hypothetical protein